MQQQHHQPNRYLYSAALCSVSEYDAYPVFRVQKAIAYFDGFYYDSFAGPVHDHSKHQRGSSQ
jgi:hypothetical protein